MVIRAAGAIIFDAHHRILLVRRGRPPGLGLWSVPGGKCEIGEATSAACVRETLEETGLSVRVERLLGSVRLSADGDDVFEVDDYLCLSENVDQTTDQADPRKRRHAVGLAAGDDASDVRWVSSAAFVRLPLVADLADMLSLWGMLPD